MPRSCFVLDNGSGPYSPGSGRTGYGSRPPRPCLSRHLSGRAGGFYGQSAKEILAAVLTL